MATEYVTLTFVAETESLARAEKRLDSVARTGTATKRSVDGVSTSASAASKSFDTLGREAAEVGLEIKKIDGLADQSAGSLLLLKNNATGLGGAAKGAGANIGGMGRNAGQAGIQIQQLVGQIQAGTNPMVALSQQATDLGFVLGVPLVGAVTGIAAAIAGPLISALVGGSDEMENLRDRIDEVTDGIDEMTAAQREYNALMEQDKIAGFKEELADVEEQINTAEEALRNFNGQSFAFGPNASQTIQELERDLARLKAERDTLIQQIDNAEGAEERFRTGQDESAESTRNSADQSARFVERLQEQADTLGMTRTETILYRAAQLDLTEAQMEEVRALTQKLDLYDREQEALQQNMAAQNAAWEEMKRRRAEFLQAQREQERESQAAIQELRKQGLLGQEENELQSLERRRERLEEFRRDQLISERQYQEASKNLDQQTFETKVGIIGDSLSALGQVNKEAFEASKAFNIAQAIMNTYTAASKALAAFPPPFNYIAAAAVTALGFKQVQAIKSQQYQGRALGGQVRAGESFVVGERGPEVLTMGSSNGRIIPNEALRESGGGQQASRTTNVTFNINTVDARGFDQLLQSRRGQIISMINSASNDRGRRAVV